MLTTLLLPTAGKGKVLGHDIVSEASEIRKKIGLCIGGTHFYHAMKPKEILTFYGMMQGIPKNRREAKIEELIRDLKMKSFLGKQFTELSTGMKQKIAIAKALINDPEVLFLDEPTNGLDVEIAFDIRNYIREVVSKSGTTVLLTSHHLYEVEDMCKRISIINHGKIVAEGSIGDVRKEVDMPDVARIVLDDYMGIEFIGNMEFVHDYYLNENGLFVKLGKGPSSIIELIKALRANKKEILDIELRKASLEEVFMKIVGGHDA